MCAPVTPEVEHDLTSELEGWPAPGASLAHAPTLALVPVVEFAPRLHEGVCPRPVTAREPAQVPEFEFVLASEAAPSACASA